MSIEIVASQFQKVQANFRSNRIYFNVFQGHFKSIPAESL